MEILFRSFLKKFARNCYSVTSRDRNRCLALLMWMAIVSCLGWRLQELELRNMAS